MLSQGRNRSGQLVTRVIFIMSPPFVTVLSYGVGDGGGVGSQGRRSVSPTLFWVPWKLYNWSVWLSNSSARVSQEDLLFETCPRKLPRRLILGLLWGLRIIHLSGNLTHISEFQDSFPGQPGNLHGMQIWLSIFERKVVQRSNESPIGGQNGGWQIEWNLTSSNQRLNHPTEWRNVSNSEFIFRRIRSITTRGESLAFLAGFWFVKSNSN